MDKVLVLLHGPNLNILGKRNKSVYVKASLETINGGLKKLAKRLRLSLTIAQSNHEGEIVELIQNASSSYKAILINPAAYTHTSVAIRDAIEACGIPVVEVHLSNIYKREEFRQSSLVAPVATGQISGFGKASYTLGLTAIAELLRNE
jgi:3-dehydroquinate dehydratase-2